MNPKTAVSAVAILAVSISVFAQGKITVVNDAASPLLYQGQPLPGPLPSGETFVVGLYGGTSSTSLFLYSTTLLDYSSAPAGSIPPFHVVLTAQTNGAPAIPGIAGGTAIGASTPWFQIRVWPSNFPSYESAVAAGADAGRGELFQMNPGPSLAYVFTAPPGLNSTWHEGPIYIYSCLGPYFEGFLTHPTNQTVVSGASAVFSVQALACPYPYFQWYFNGSLIAGATSSSYGISQVQPTNAGTYSVVLNNPAWGVRDGGSATLTVLVPPDITIPPPSQTAESGSAAGFTVEARGSPPIQYQWWFEASPLSAATNATLHLTSVQADQAGAYAVVITNVAGATTSPPARLAVIPPIPRKIVPGLLFAGQPGTTLHMYGSGNLSQPAGLWPFLDSVLLTNSSQWYFDLTTPLAGQRFYRAWQTNSGGTLSSWNLNGIPALTLTGAIGNSVRIDWINQVGPIDAWVNLATVALTNNSQLYFDTSVIGQPPRLWRVAPAP